MFKPSYARDCRGGLLAACTLDLLLQLQKTLDALLKFAGNNLPDAQLLFYLLVGTGWLGGSD